MRRRQVYVEAIILEVRLDTTRELGIELQGAHRARPTESASAAPTSATSTTLSPARPSISGLILAAASSQTVRLPMGQWSRRRRRCCTASAGEHRRQHSLGAEHPDHRQPGSGDRRRPERAVHRQPSTSEINLANTFATIERRDVGITLRITPQISEGGSVRLDIFQEVSAVIRPRASTPAARPDDHDPFGDHDGRRARRADGRDRRPDLRRHRTTTSKASPSSSDIPVLGNLLPRRSAQRAKINLLIFLTPHIIRNEREQRDSVDRERDELQRVHARPQVPQSASRAAQHAVVGLRPCRRKSPRKRKGSRRTTRRGRLDRPTRPSWHGRRSPAAVGGDASGRRSIEPPVRDRYVLLASFWDGNPASSLQSAATACCPSSCRPTRH